MKNVFVILGESGSGKSTLVKMLNLADVNLEHVVTTTTRPIRQGEVNGVDYHFVSDEVFLDEVKKDNMLEHTSFRDWYYGINNQGVQDSKSNNIILILSPQGLNTLYEKLNPNEYKIIPIYIFTNEKVRLNRSIERDSDMKEVCRRFIADLEDFEDIMPFVLKNHGYIVNNLDDIENALHYLKHCIQWSIKNG